MHSWKKITLVNALEKHLPGDDVDCVFDGWTATIWITSGVDKSSFTTTGIDLAKIEDREGILDLANEIAFEVGMTRERAADSVR
ncbi:hypothetical protein [Pseudomonas fluorescens]|uniref:Uncharacterized protein n=1 Tax=Pseudomonas fluorescens TaxID=294 RepID=A0A2T0I3K1_PSEFL|nr:hypothetical protein [Pseudomonas fluorescens]PRW89888.1 hypothetical protein C7A10_19285 [Pseudomonas fluorescens]